MNAKMQWFIAAAAVTQLVCPIVNGMELVLMAGDGKPLVIDIADTVTLQELQEHLGSLAAPDQGQWFLMAARDNNSSPMSPRAAEPGYSRDGNLGARDFYYSPTADDKANIGYVVKTLANKNEISLLLYSSAIQSAGDSVKHIHPLKFLSVIFCDEELKVGIRNIRKKSLVWKRFRGGIADSLTDEQAANNMKPEYLVDFCNQVGLNVNLVQGLYQQNNWREFLDILVAKVPRKGDYRRYDMSMQ